MIDPKDFNALEPGDVLELPPMLPSVWPVPTLLTLTQWDGKGEVAEFTVTASDVHIGKCLAYAKNGKVVWE